MKPVSPFRQTHSKRVLVVDDTPEIVSVLAEILQCLEETCVVETAFNGREALAKVQQSAYSLMITDYWMPGMTGLELAQAVCRVSPDTQIVLMSSANIAKLRRESRGLELAAYLQKPFSVTKLLDVVRHAVA